MTQIVVTATGGSGFSEVSSTTLASATITNTQVIPAETVTLTGTLTINTGKTLCLARLFGDDDVTLTTSGSATITGAGTLRKESLVFGVGANGNFGVPTMSIIGGGTSVINIREWIEILIIFDVVYLVVCPWAFGFVVEE